MESSSNFKCILMNFNFKGPIPCCDINVTPIFDSFFFGSKYNVIVVGISLKLTSYIKYSVEIVKISCFKSCSTCS